VLGSIIPDLLYWEVLWIVITISWKRNKIIARHLQSQENIWKRGQTTMPQADFEPMIPGLERSKIISTLRSAASINGFETQVLGNTRFNLN